jgi:hypothetical protein
VVYVCVCEKEKIFSNELKILELKDPQS